MPMTPNIIQTMKQTVKAQCADDEHHEAWRVRWALPPGQGVSSAIALFLSFVWRNGPRYRGAFADPSLDARAVW